MYNFPFNTAFSYYSYFYGKYSDYLCLFVSPVQIFTTKTVPPTFIWDEWFSFPSYYISKKKFQLGQFPPQSRFFEELVSR